MWGNERVPALMELTVEQVLLVLQAAGSAHSSVPEHQVLGVGVAGRGGGSQPLPQAWQPREEQSKGQCDPSASCTQPF